MKYNTLFLEEETIHQNKNTKILPTINCLNKLLANYLFYHQNLQTFLQNVTKNKKYFDLQKKLEGLQTDTELKIKEIGERIIELKYNPINTLSNYSTLTEIKDSRGKSLDKEISLNLLESQKILIENIANTVEVAANFKDEKTVDMMIRFMKNIEDSVD